MTSRKRKRWKKKKKEKAHDCGPRVYQVSRPCLGTRTSNIINSKQHLLKPALFPSGFCFDAGKHGVRRKWGLALWLTAVTPNQNSQQCHRSACPARGETTRPFALFFYIWENDTGLSSGAQVTRMRTAKGMGICGMTWSNLKTRTQKVRFLNSAESGYQKFCS